MRSKLKIFNKLFMPSLSCEGIDYHKIDEEMLELFLKEYFKEKEIAAYTYKDISFSGKMENHVSYEKDIPTYIPSEKLIPLYHGD